MLLDFALRVAWCGGDPNIVAMTSAHALISTPLSRDSYYDHVYTNSSIVDKNGDKNTYWNDDEEVRVRVRPGRV